MTNTPDYNNGLWHGWNGGECPVHPESIIEIVSSSGNLIKMVARCGAWDHTIMQLIAFRVTKEHNEPKEFWLCYRLLADVAEVRYSLPHDNEDYLTVIHVREVT